ncbi:hypothetical protein F441_04138 [Phytophthora nicotianae CJ01A1]|uniref:Ubiquitin-like protease family profile domain-containing protein n=2 Tax=Phytophthora nicotianae TaxID=4792 RepID=W2XI81_PHYNI|nr:hypothetical protein F444_22522 [Phytophthora nicotianae P1976]ETP22600.1 hypothetical protein F441_04138 [Phytophthora nicotianae CJ01A1]
MIRADSLGVSKIETIKKVAGGYFDEELKKQYPSTTAPDFVVRGICTKPIQKNSHDCGVFMLYFIKRAYEAFMQDNTQLLSDIEKICTAP